MECRKSFLYLSGETIWPGFRLWVGLIVLGWIYFSGMVDIPPIGNLFTFGSWCNLCHIPYLGTIIGHGQTDFHPSPTLIAHQDDDAVAASPWPMPQLRSTIIHWTYFRFRFFQYRKEGPIRVCREKRESKVNHITCIQHRARPRQPASTPLSNNFPGLYPKSEVINHGRCTKFTTPSPRGIHAEFGTNANERQFDVSVSPGSVVVCCVVGVVCRLCISIWMAHMWIARVVVLQVQLRVARITIRSCVSTIPTLIRAEHIHS